MLRGRFEVRGMIVKGMGKSVVRFIPLTVIPLTSLWLFPSANFHARFGCGWPCWAIRGKNFARLGDSDRLQYKEGPGAIVPTQ